MSGRFRNTCARSVTPRCWLQTWSGPSRSSIAALTGRGSSERPNCTRAINWRFMRDERIISSAAQDDERQFEAALRPSRLDDFSGQTRVKEVLKIAIEAARQRGEAMDHVLLYGPPGLGKTTLALIISQELGVSFQQT